MLRDDPLSVLALCTGNSARSIFAEALLCARGGDRVTAVSAGTNPLGMVNPAALRLLAARGIAHGVMRSKSWRECMAPGAPRLDLVIVLCTSASTAMTRALPGRPARVDWPLTDPMTAPAEQRALAFGACFGRIEAGIGRLLALDLERLSNQEIADALTETALV